MTKTTMIFAAPPEHQGALRFGVPVAHMGYRIGAGGHLLHGHLPPSLRGGLLMISDHGFAGHIDQAVLCREIMQECTNRYFEGVVADFEQDANPLLGGVIGELIGLLDNQGWPLYIPESYAGFCGRARILISTALSGGSLSQRLSDVAQKYDGNRIALDVERVAMDFTLPCPSGEGKSLAQFELQKLITDNMTNTFFSKELCAYYFTYTNRSGMHFVLYDDACSILQKLQVAMQYGIHEAFVVFPEIQDIAREIL